MAGNFDTHKWFKKQYLEEANINDVREGKEHSSNVEAHELNDMIQDALEDLEPSSDLIIRVSMSSPPDGSDYGYNGYDVEFETLGNTGDEDVNWMREGKTKTKKPKHKQ
tara:strand:- start:3606 stop:3932 length:327 start_codon:yes stop_codon:yes gene_type:complete